MQLAQSSGKLLAVDAGIFTYPGISSAFEAFLELKDIGNLYIFGKDAELLKTYFGDYRINSDIARS